MWPQIVKLLSFVAKHRKADLCTQLPKTVNVEINKIIKPTDSNTKLEPFSMRSYLQGTKYNSRETFPFDEVPGPVSLKNFSKVWSFIPMLGTETTTRLIRYLLQKDSMKEPRKLLFKRIFDQYGPIVKLNGIFGSDVILLCRPEHANIALNSEQHFYIRSYFDSVEKYRQEWRKYTRSGPFLKFDEDWEGIKKSLQEEDIALSTQYQIDDSICENFLTKIVEKRNSHDEISDGLKQELYKWCLHSLSITLFNNDLGFSKHDFLSPTSDPGRLLDGLTGATEALRRLETGFHFWKFSETPTLHALIRNCNLIDGVLSKYLEKAMKALRERKEKQLVFNDLSLVEGLLVKKDLVEEDIMTILLDTYLISANAAVHTVALMLFHLAKNPRSQIKLYDEILNKGEIVTCNNIDTRTYLNACIKECLRLDPPITIISRQLENDVVINHYRIPKDTHIFYSTHLNSNREDYFEDANRFKPERWLLEDLGEYGRDYQTFATSSFGFGPDAQTVRDILFLHIAKLLVKIIRTFKIEFNYGITKSNLECLTPNNKMIKLRFVNRVR